MDVNTAIVKALEQIGVDTVFGGSGQVNGSMMLALRDSKTIKTIPVRNEQAASFMACGYAMFSDKLGVCFSTGGPGEFNLFSGLAVAYSDSLPVLAVSGYVSQVIEGKGALNESSGKNRTPDTRAMFNATTKKSFIISRAEDACDIIEEAINLAFEGRPGPVHIHVPKDITTAEVPNYREVKLRIKPVLPDPLIIMNVAGAIKNAIIRKEKIGLLVGYGTLRSKAGKDVLEFAEKYQLPFMTTMDGKGIMPENHPLSLGVYGTSGDPGALEYFENANMIIALGNSFAQNATFNYRNVYRNKTLIHINIDSNELGKVYQPDYPVCSDIKPATKMIMERLSESEIKVQPVKLIKDKYYDKVLENASDKMHPGILSQIISRHLPPDSFLLGDAGSGMLWLNCYTQLTANQHFQNPGSFGPMASHVNGAIGIKCANPNSTVVCVPGDGAYLMGGFELLTCVDNNIPLIWIILNNGEFNIVKKFLLNIYGDYAFMKFSNPDYVKFAEACGAVGFRAETAEQFEEAYLKALAMNQPVLIDAVIDPDLYPPFSLGKV
jgi:acetolactate synthase I/II/III large subunit